MKLGSPLALLGVTATLALAASFVAGCGRSTAASPAGSPRTASATVAPTASVSPTANPSAASYPEYSDVPRGPAKKLPFHEYLFKGQWIVRDYDDGLCALDQERMTYPLDRLFLLDVATGRSRCVLPRPVNFAKRYELMESKVSSRWVAWVELSPGDDLVQAVTWRLYVARVDRRTLRIGKPRLVDGDTTKRTSRPMFALSGDTLVWRVNGQRDPARPGLVYAARLGGGGPVVGRVIWRTKGLLTTLGASKDRVYALERTSTKALPYRLLVARLASPGDILSVDLRNENDVGGYPAVGGEWAAWSLFANEEDGTSGILYLREPGGRVHLVATPHACSPCFAGGRLFYTDVGYDKFGPGLSRVCMVDLATMKWSVVQQVDSSLAGDVNTLYTPGAAEHTLVTYRTTPDFKSTIVRVYRVD